MLMDDEVREDGQTFTVVCVWCGAEIRRAVTPEAPGMCQACFRQMVEEHARLAAQQGRVHASER